MVKCITSKKKKLNLSNACKSVHQRVLDVFLCLFGKRVNGNRFTE